MRNSKTNIPSKGIRYASLDKINGIVQQSYHSISKVKKKHKPNATWYLKCYKPNEVELAEIESAIGEVYRIILGEMAPKVRPVYNKNNELVGSISKELPDFSPLSDSCETPRQLIDKGIAEILLTSFWLAEDDLHKGNFGANGRYDYDGSLWEMTSKRKGTRIGVNWILPEPGKAFPITEQDIIDFPDIKDAQPFYWCTRLMTSRKESDYILNFARKKAYTAIDRDGFATLATKHDFIQKKFKTILKILLIPKQQFINIAEAMISSPLTQREFSQLLIKRQRMLYDVCKEIKAFRVFIRSNREVYIAIKEELGEYCSSFTDPNDTDLHIDFGLLQLSYDSIWRSSHEHLLVWALHALATLIRERLNCAGAIIRHDSEQLYLDLLTKTEEYFKLEYPDKIATKSYVEQSNKIIKKGESCFIKLDMGLQCEWQYISESIINVLNSLNGSENLINISTLSKGYLRDTMHFSAIQAETNPNIHLTSKAFLDQLIISLADEIYRWQYDSANQATILATTKDAIEEYLPKSEPDSAWSYFDYRYYTRNRIPEISQLQKQLPNLGHAQLVDKILDLCDKPDWRAETTFNFTIMKKLYTSFTVAFRSQSLLVQLSSNYQLFTLYNYIDKNMLHINNHLKQIHNHMFTTKNTSSKELRHA